MPISKNKAAQILGRLGGLKGGKARAEKLSPERRQEIARKAIQARWDKVAKETDSKLNNGCRYRAAFGL